jgi:hypothetical protein
MASYRFILLATDGSVETNWTRESLSDDEACELGTELLLRSKSNVLEIWRGSTMIFRVTKVDREHRVAI